MPSVPPHLFSLCGKSWGGNEWQERLTELAGRADVRKTCNFCFWPTTSVCGATNFVSTGRELAMSALVKLNLKTVKRVTEVDPVTARRDRLVAGIDEQLAALAAALVGKTHTVEVKRAVRDAEGVRNVVTVARQVRAWHFAQDGGYYAQCRYGTRVLMLHGKSNAVFVDKLEQVAEVLGVFRTAALAGDFDRAVLLLKSRSS
jgi:hypothetical protein